MPENNDDNPTPDSANTAEQLYASLANNDPKVQQQQLDTIALLNPQLAEQVRNILTAKVQSPSEASTVDTPSLKKFLGQRLVPGDTFGKYTILEQLGQGGFGTVYKAEQRKPVKRLVALKVIKPGVDTKEVIARFNSERQALARMDHPNIAKVLDAGSTETGRPYFVMEYVPGAPLTQFADRNKLTLEDRLHLFIKVCDAIAHAHQKAIIHRDIKDTNILAYLKDGKPQVKVIDFGIAKALTADRLTDLTFNTSAGMVIGTYSTMSPEQADGSPDIDTRTDVYSLGVLLYELLTGAKPFDPKELAQSADTEIRRIIREVEPQTPSTKLTSLTNKQCDALAKARQLQLKDLQRRLKSELEWIPLKAIRKERDRRYDSPQQMAEDIGRYLQGEALIAGPETRLYRVQKFVRRNSSAVALLSVVMLALLVGFAGAFWGWSREQAAAEQAQAQRAIAEQTNTFLVETFDLFRPEYRMGPEDTPAMVLERAIERLNATHEGNTLGKASIQFSLASVFKSLGSYQVAQSLFEEARATRRDLLGPDHSETLEADAAYAGVLKDLKRDEEAEPIYRRVHKAYARDLGDGDQKTLEVKNNLALVLYKQSVEKAQEAGQLFADAWRGYQDHQDMGPAHDDTLRVQANYANYFKETRQFERARELMEPVLAQQRKRMDAGTMQGRKAEIDVLATMNELAGILRRLQDWDAGKPLYLEAIAGRQRLLGEHPATKTVILNYAYFLIDWHISERDAGVPGAGRAHLVEAQPLLQEAKKMLDANPKWDADRTGRAGLEKYLAYCKTQLQ